MTTKISSLTVVNQGGTQIYVVGLKYNDLVLDSIKDKSIEYPDSFHSIYQGFTVEGDLVFEVINAPVEISYCPA